MGDEPALGSSLGRRLQSGIGSVRFQQESILRDVRQALRLLLSKSGCGTSNTTMSVRGGLQPTVHSGFSAIEVMVLYGVVGMNFPT